MRSHHNTPSTARPGWLVLLVVLAIVLTTVWAREGETGPLHRVRSGIAVVVAPVSAAGEFVTRPVRGFFAWANDLGVSRSRLEELRQQNAALRSRVAELEEAGLENARLRPLVDLVQARDLDAIAAHVIGRPTSAWDGVITIDRGSTDGLRTGMPVIGPLGLLGQTVQVSPGSSRIRLITDQRSMVAAMVQRNRAEGILRGSVDGGLTLDFVSAETTLQAGDVVITSGIGGVFPKGLVIGELDADLPGSSGLLQSVRVSPAGDPSRLEEVLVLLGEPPLVETGGGE